LRQSGTTRKHRQRFSNSHLHLIHSPTASVKEFPAVSSSAAAIKTLPLLHYTLEGSANTSTLVPDGQRLLLTSLPCPSLPYILVSDDTVATKHPHLFRRF
ncbi:hypothetical protein CRENBAI_011177, partial [Crenichthys baileyi]